MTTDTKKTYLGDGVYAELDYGVRLTTENGFRVTNTIVLEPEVLSALAVYMVQHGFQFVLDVAVKKSGDAK